MENWFLQRTFQPIFTGFHINVTQNRISSGGWDTWDDFWYNMSSYSVSIIVSNLESLLAHNIIDANHIVTETTVSSASAAAATLTGAANTNEKVVTAYGKNSTRAHQWTFDHTPSGGSTAQIADSGAGNTGQGENCFGIGSSSADINHPMNPIWLQPGDVLVATNTNFVAADVMEIGFVSEVYSM